MTPSDERAVRPVERSAVARRLLEAGEASGYRVDRLREALASGVAPGTSSTPRLPRATGLPPGPLDAAGAPRGPSTRRGPEPDDITPADWAADAAGTGEGEPPGEDEPSAEAGAPSEAGLPDEAETPAEAEPPAEPEER